MTTSRRDGPLTTGRWPATAGAVSVVIPTLNEQEWIGASVASAFSAGAAEVIVSDGGSSDATVARARAAGALVLQAARMRSRQLNEGARAATGDDLIFLHADTLLPAGAAQAVSAALASGADFGGFRIAFIEGSPRLRFAAAAINLRTRLTRCPWGDQAQFIRRGEFLRIGGYREIAIMEDYELAVRMNKSGHSVVLPLSVRTSGRRFLARGLVRTSLMNWRIVAAWRMGADPEKLARLYRA